jgi:hypothetical protein
MLPKPRLLMSRGYWVCGIVGDDLGWSVAPTPAKAYELWARSQEKAE